jgi:DedD protein
MDKALKQRLVGAVVLIALAVIVLPMIFGGRPSSLGPETRSVELPAAPPDLDFETRRFPVGEPPSRDTSQIVPQPDHDEESATATENITPLPRPNAPPLEAQETVEEEEAELLDEAPSGVDLAEEAEAEAVEAQAAESMDTLVAGLMASEEPDSSLRYVVQVASFGSTENALRLSEALGEGGYAVLLDHVSNDSSQLNRVRVGPYATEAEAQLVATQLQESFSGINPRIVDMQPDQATPALANDDSLMRWIVQVGSFSSSENARQLVSRLRTAGLSAYDETVSTNNSTIYRVRVGPYLDRGEALQAEQRIGNDFGIDGVVMSSD